MICPRSHTKYWISQYSRPGLLNPTLVFLEAERLWKGGGGGAVALDQGAVLTRLLFLQECLCEHGG